MIEKNKIMILCSICTLIFVSGEGGMPGLSHALVPAQESKRWSFGRLLLLPVIQKGLFLGPKKSRKIRHANTGLISNFAVAPAGLICLACAILLAVTV